MSVISIFQSSGHLAILSEVKAFRLHSRIFNASQSSSLSELRLPSPLIYSLVKAVLHAINCANFSHPFRLSEASLAHCCTSSFIRATLLLMSRVVRLLKLGIMRRFRLLLLKLSVCSAVLFVRLRLEILLLGAYISVRAVQPDVLSLVRAALLLQYSLVRAVWLLTSSAVSALLKQLSDVRAVFC